MPRGRFVGREVSTSERLANCSGPNPDKSRLLWTWSVPWSDRDGRLPGSAAVLRGLIVPMLGWSLAETEAAIVDLEGVGLVRRYEDGEGRRVMQLWNFDAHQKGMNYAREAASKYGDGPEESGYVRTKSGVVRPKYKGKSKSKPKYKGKKDQAADAATARVWAAFSAKRAGRYPKGNGLLLSKDRESSIKARLKDYGEERVMAALAKFFDPSLFWAKGDHAKRPELLFRSVDQFEKIEAASPSKAPGIGRGYVQHGGQEGIAMLPELNRKTAELKRSLAKETGT